MRTKSEYIAVKKRVITLPECDEMLLEEFAYIAKDSLKQAEIFVGQFEETLERIGQMPKLGVKYKNGMRKIKLGKFRYYIYYREREDLIEVLGIWHTSRGTQFMAV